MALAGRLLAQMDVHYAGACVECRLCLARHLLRGDRYMMLFRIGQHAVQRAGDDSLVAHGAALIVLNFRRYAMGSWALRPKASCVQLLPPATARLRGKPALSSTRGTPR